MLLAGRHSSERRGIVSRLSTKWSFHATDEDECTVVWGADARVQAVEGNARVKRPVMP